MKSISPVDTWKLLMLLIGVGIAAGVGIGLITKKTLSVMISLGLPLLPLLPPQLRPIAEKANKSVRR